MSVTSDEQTLRAASELLGDETSTPVRRRALPGPQWWPWAAGVAVALLVGVLVGRSTASEEVVEEGPRTATRMLAAGGPLGDIGGTSTQDLPAEPADGERDRRDAATRWIAETGADTREVAWPGQVLTAPDPTEGRAVAWQWQTCTPPPVSDDDEDAGERGELECEAVGGASEETWTSPPTPSTRLLRVVVTIDMGGDVLVRAASDPITAMAWPEGLAPGEAVDDT